MIAENELEKVASYFVSLLPLVNIEPADGR